MSKLSIETFRQRYHGLNMECKVLWTQGRIRDFYNHFQGDVFLSFSGGKDSQVLAEIIKEMGSPYDKIELVFFNTHNEDPTVLEIVKRYGATVVDSPLKPREVIEKVGYPLFNKDVANVIDDIQRGVPYTKDPNCARRAEVDKIKLVYADFIKSPLRISDKCCDELKKKPSHGFVKRTGKRPIIATLAVESKFRMISYLKHGCSIFEGRNIKSTPMGMWSKKNILEFIASRNMKIADCYKFCHKEKKCKGKDQTGCMFCGFGKGIEYAYGVLKAKHPEYYATLKRGEKK